VVVTGLALPNWLADAAVLAVSINGGAASLPAGESLRPLPAEHP
jgi:hypothetical protein